MRYIYSSLVSLLSLVFMFGNASFAQTNIPSSTIQFDGSVFTSYQIGDTVLLGGNFTRVFTKANSAQFGSAYSLATWSLQLNYPSPDNNVFAAISDNYGGWYIGGDFAMVGTVNCNKLAHILANGNVEPLLNESINGSVRALSLVNNQLIIAGSFTTIGSATRNRIASIDLNTSTLTAWNPNVNGQINALIAHGDTVFAGGAFTLVNTLTRSNLAAFTVSNGNLLSGTPAVNAAINAMDKSGNALYFAGSFTTVGTTARSRAAAIQFSNYALTTFNPAPNNVVSGISVNNGFAYLGGSFTTVNGTLARNRIAKVNQFTGIATGWNPNANNLVSSIFSVNNLVFVGGSFTTISGTAVTRLIALDTGTASIMNSWIPNPSSGINVFSYSAQNQLLYTGGSFANVGGVPITRFAAIDLNNGNILPINITTDAPIHTIDVAGSTIYIGGSFTSVNSVARAGCAAYDVTSQSLTSFNPLTNGIVNSIVHNNQLVFIGGTFSDCGGTPRNSLAAFDLLSGAINAWDPSPSGSSVEIKSLKIKGNNLAVGGTFTTISGSARNNLALYNTSNLSLHTIECGTNGVVNSLDFYNNHLYVGGSFGNITIANSSPSSMTVNNVGTINLTTGGLVNPMINANGEIVSLDISNDNLYLSGVFTSINNTPRSRIAAYNLLNNTLYPWFFTPNSTVRTVNGNNQHVIIGGDFTSISNKLLRGAVRLEPAFDFRITNVSATQFCSNDSFSLTYFYNKFSDNGNFNFEAELVPSQGNGNPIVIGQLNAIGSGILRGVIPSEVLPGSYILRVVNRSNGDISFNSFSVSLNASPNASFRVVTSDACVNTNQFTILNESDITSGTFNSNWQFGDGTTATNNTETFNKSYTQAGTYTIQLTTVSNTGCTAITTQSIDVLPVYTPQITATSPGLCPGQSTTLSFANEPGNTFQWLVNNLPMNGNTDTAITVSTGGNYQAIATNIYGCTDTSEVITIGAFSIIRSITTSSVPTICLGDSVQLSAINQNNGIILNWFRNGDPINVNSNQIFTQQSGIFYFVALAANGCSDTSETITVSVLPRPVAQFSISSNSICSGESAVVSAVTGNWNYQWFNGTVPVGMNQPVVSVTTPGVYRVKTTDTNGCSSVSLPQDLTVRSLPDASVNAEGSLSVCAGEGVLLRTTESNASYLWTANNTIVGTDSVILATTQGVYQLTVTKNGCSSTSDPVALTVFGLPDAGITASAKQACVGNTISFVANTENATYVWQRNGNTIENENQHILNVTEGGSYSLILTDSNGCSNVSPVIPVSFNALPVVGLSLSGDSSICEGSSSVIHTTGAGLAATFQWFRNDTAISGQIGNKLNATQSGIYKVRTTNGFGCSAFSREIEITVVPNPIASIQVTGGTSFCNGRSAQLSVAHISGNQYKWFNGNTVLSETSSAITVTTAGSYSVQVTNTNGCKNLSAPVTITVSSISVSVSATGSTSLCPGQTVTLTASPSSSSMSYQWFRNDSLLIGSTQATLSASVTGSYRVQMINPNGCVGLSTPIVVNQSQGPNASFTFPKTGMCANESIQLTATQSGAVYQWFLNNMPISNATGRVLTINAAGNYQLRVSQNGCSQLSAPVSFNQFARPTAVVNSNGPTNVCEGSAVTLTANSNLNSVSYVWRRNNTIIQPLQTGRTLTVTESGNYSVIISNGGCENTSSHVRVNIEPRPKTSAIAGNTNVRSGSTHNYCASSSGNNSYLWFVQNGTIVGSNRSNVVRIRWNNRTGQGIVYLREANCNGCIGDTTFLAVNIGSTNETISVNRDTISFNGAGGSQTFQITSNATWTILENTPWFSVNQTNGSNNATITVTASALNGNQAARVSELEVVAGSQRRKIVIRQSANGFTGFNESIESVFKVYPNPTTGVIFIENTSFDVLDITIQDVQGKIVFQSGLHNGSQPVDLSAYTNGMYVIQVGKGEEKAFYKIVLTR